MKTDGRRETGDASNAPPAASDGVRPPNRTTDPHAEVLYPFELSLTYLRTITARTDDGHEAAAAALTHFAYEPRVEIDPEAFR